MTAVAVIGASGIGGVHVRELLAAGARVAAVLGSSPASTRTTADAVAERFGIPVEASANLDALLATSTEGVVIATPAHTHRALLEATLGAGKWVLCEKPLFWPVPADPRETERGLAGLEQLGGARLALNTCNAFLLEPARDLLGLPAKPGRFRFEFFTRGPHRGAALGADLLPHALSLLQRLEPEANVEQVRCRIEQHEFRCALRCGALECTFRLRQHPDGPKHLAFGLDDTLVVRDAGSEDGRYRIRLQREDAPEQRIEVPDPFASAAADFLRGIETGARFAHDFAFAARNLRLLATILRA